MMKSVLENGIGLYRQRVGQARHISDQGEDGVAHPYNVADGVTDACPYRKSNPLAVDRESGDAAARC